MALFEPQIKSSIKQIIDKVRLKIFNREISRFIALCFLFSKHLTIIDTDTSELRFEISQKHLR